MKVRTKIFAIVAILALSATVIAGIAVYAVRTLAHESELLEQAGRRALYAERLDRLVTAVVMAHENRS